MRITRGALSFEVGENTDEGLLVTLTDGDGPTVELLLGGWAPWEGQSRPKTLAVTILQPDGSRSVRIPLERYESFVADQLAEVMALFAGDDRYRQARSRGRSTRTTITDDLLAKIAEAYRTASEGERTAAVKAVHPVSTSQVYRLLAEARRRGILAEGGR